MKLSLALSVLSTLRAVQAVAVPAADSINFVLPESIKAIHWEVLTNDPGAAPLEIDGTIEELHTQLSVINPNYLQEFNITTVLLADTDAPVAVTAARKHKRSENTVAISHYKEDAIRDGINYLRQLPGVARLPKGPNHCTRVSCSYNSGIHLCNDSLKPIERSWDKVADYAAYAFNNPKLCWGRYFCVAKTNGENEDGLPWSVEITSEHC